MGIANHAIGKASAAFGRKNYTSGGYSFAAGRENRVAQYGVAFGKLNKVDNTGAAAFGFNNMADGEFSIATGNCTVASGRASFAGGVWLGEKDSETVASGDCAFAYGWNAIASGKCSFAFGAQPRAEGDYAIAMGQGSKAYGSHSIALGTGNHISVDGSDSIALGNFNTINYPHTFLLGENLVGPNTDYSTIVGRYNSIGDSTNYPIFAVGNGTSNSDRKNAFEILNDGRANFSGNICLTGGDSGHLILNNYFKDGKPTCFIRGTNEDARGGININDEIILGHGTNEDESLNMPILYPKTTGVGKLGYADNQWADVYAKSGYFEGLRVTRINSSISLIQLDFSDQVTTKTFAVEGRTSRCTILASVVFNGTVESKIYSVAADWHLYDLYLKGEDSTNPIILWDRVFGANNGKDISFEFDFDGFEKMGDYVDYEGRTRENWKAKIKVTCNTPWSYGFLIVG